MKLVYYIFIVVFSMAICSCQQKRITEWQYVGGLPIHYYGGNESAPGMVLVEGGVFTIKNENEPSIKKKINTFYISTHEETNAQYLAYLTFIKKYYSKATYSMALPDTTVWLKESIGDSLKNYMVQNYLRSRSFQDYPVVGLNPEQIKRYCIWKTDRLNEMIIISEGILDFDTTGTDSIQLFTSTENYPPDTVENRIIPIKVSRAPQDVRMEDGIYMPQYRLPTSDEWKVASLAIGDESHSYVETPKEFSNKKFDKYDYYGFLYVKRKVNNKQLPILSLPHSIPLRPVYYCEHNNYLVYGLSDNVSEVVKTKNQFFVEGGSWKSPGPYYSSIYDNTLADSLKYKSTFDFKPVGGKENIVSAETGFRLAMNFEEYYEGKLPYKRRKVK